jgi:hypothetical protein
MKPKQPASDAPKKSQIEKFREAARAHECDEDEVKFDEMLKAVARPLKKNRG